MAAFLFTDVEGSIKRWNADPEMMHLDLVDHDLLIRRAVEAQGGEIFAVTGDGFGAAFPAVTAAVESAVDIQIRLEAALFMPRLRVRIGIHAGPAFTRDANYYGPTVNLCARLTAVAWGGQVLISGESKSLLAHPIELFDLGAYYLKDLPRPLQILQIIHPRLSRSFPPLVIRANPHRPRRRVHSVDSNHRDSRRLVGLLPV